MTLAFLAIIAQIEQALEIAGKGATMGGQAILITFLILMAWVVKSMHNSNKEQTAQALAAHERQHGELLLMLNSERDAGKKERDANHEALIRIATESATGLQATAAAINGSTTMMGSLRDTLHAMRGDMQHRQTERDNHH